LTIVDPSYFWTKRRWQQLELARAQERFLARGQERSETRAKERSQERARGRAKANDGRFGTVGAVALDRHGNLAVATSTGGLTNKMPGRIGDSAIIGSGTYADNTTCAVSTTGHGESFMRQVVAYDIGARMKYKSCSLAQAAEDVIMGTFQQAGGEGGAIALDAAGNCVMPFNSEGMYRGCISRTGKTRVAIFR
jgi:beta-aspartyl-peptidase (threonine type)